MRVGPNPTRPPSLEEEAVRAQTRVHTVDTERRRPSARQPPASQGERPQRKPALRTPRSWTFSLRRCAKINFCGILARPPSRPRVTWAGCSLPASREEDGAVSGKRCGAAGPGGTLPKSAVWLGSTGQAAGPGAAFVACSMRPWPWPSPHRQIRAFPEMITISHTTLRAAPGPCQGKKHTVLPFYE